MDEAGKKRLLEEYAANKRPETREQLILEYAPLVKVVAGRLSMYLGYNVDYEDLVSYGIFGLIDAIDKFDCLKEVKFETYASLRIRGLKSLKSLYDFSSKSSFSFSIYISVASISCS